MRETDAQERYLLLQLVLMILTIAAGSIALILPATREFTLVFTEVFAVCAVITATMRLYVARS